MLQGLANTGNTCSINTLIQCLGHCPSLRRFILEQDIPIQKKEGKKYSIYEELKIIFHQMWKENHSLIPSRFLKAFYESIGDLYMPGEQFDFTEMWMLLLNNLMEETHKEGFISLHQQKNNYSEPMLQYLQEKSQDAWHRFFYRDTNSPLNDILQGTQIQQIECQECKHVYHNIEPISFSYLDISGEHIGESFQKLLQSELIEGWKCDHCQKNVVADKVIRFWKLPQVWVIILKRFDQQQKILQPIHLTKQFTILKGIEFQTLPISEGEATYELVGIANHFGSLHGGHYNAICKNDTENSWYIYDDLHVQKIENIEEALQHNTSSYALFYERKNKCSNTNL